MSVRARLGAALSALVFALLVVVARPAHAWVEVHVEGDDIKITLEKNGEARVEHKIILKTAGAPLRSLDIRGVDADASPDPEGYVVPQKEAARGSLASALGVTTERLPLDMKPRADGSPAPTVLRVRFDSERGLTRGVYVLLVRYTTHLVPRPTAGSPLARVEWHGPVWDDGFDSARVTFDLPAAPTEPRADDSAPEGDGAARAPLVLSNVRRGAARDQIELLRPYAPKGEAITWAIRADARALQPPPPAPSKSASVRATIDSALGGPAPRLLLVAGALGLFLLYSVLVALKAAETARLARAAGTEAAPLVPIPAPARAVIAGAALVGGLFVQMILVRATAGALLVLAAVVLAAHRTPRWRVKARGPGRWLPVAEATALRVPPRPRGAYLDVSTREGKAIFVVLLAAVGALVAWLYELTPHRAMLVACDATALLAIFGTGRLAELPPDPATAPVPLLRAVAKRLRKLVPEGDLRLVGRIRVPEGSPDADELRLAVSPRTALAGFGAIEIGVVYARGAGGPIGIPEVILRVTAGSPCEEAVERLARHGRSTRGRKPNERAIVFSPKLPTARMTAGIVASLVRALTARTARAEKPAARATKHAA